MPSPVRLPPVSAKMVPSISKSAGTAFLRLQDCRAARRDRRRDFARGRVRRLAGIDVRTGAKLWDFHSVPQPGEPGHETWLNDGWKNRSGVNVWGWYLTLDEKTGTVYMPFGSPAGNYSGGDRPGNNLFGNSVIAVDAMTGKLKWHFQTVHHDLWARCHLPVLLVLNKMEEPSGSCADWKAEPGCSS